MPGRNFLEYWSCKALSHAFVTCHCDIIATLFFFLTYQEVLDLSTKYASLRSYVLWQCARNKKGLYTAQFSNLSCKLLVSVNQHYMLILIWHNTVIIIIIIDIIYSCVPWGHRASTVGLHLCWSWSTLLALYHTSWYLSGLTRCFCAMWFLVCHIFVCVVGPSLLCGVPCSTPHLSV